jgi:VIT1/CCC1 family predicted Fe2+/Mn2+ transporter
MTFIYEFVSPGSVEQPYVVSSLVAGLAFFLVGAIKGRFVLQPWYWAGAETCIVGGAAAALAYLIGLVLRGVVS